MFIEGKVEALDLIDSRMTMRDGDCRVAESNQSEDSFSDVLRVFKAGDCFGEECL